ncbi:MAG: hypothetical protein ABMB14_32355 [Myxococcota bacterium]
MIPITVAILGQSNASGVTGPSPFSLADQRARGARVIDNGDELDEYPAAVGPEPWVVDELLGLGFAPTVVIRAIPGINLESIRSEQLPDLIADFDTGPVAGLTPDFVILWQGEADARTESFARTYHDRLVGPWGESKPESVRDVLHDAWPFVSLLVVELRLRDYDYGAFHPVVRAAQHLAGTMPGVCVVPSYDAPLMPGQNQPHVSVDGLDIVGRRAVAAGIAVIGGERCP